MATNLYAELCDTLIEIALYERFIPIDILRYVRQNLNERNLHSANNATILSQEEIESNLGEWGDFDYCPSESMMAAILADYPVVSFTTAADTLWLNLDRPSETQLLTLALETSPDEMVVIGEQDGKLLVRMWWD